eukprot:2550561-Pleurochrysis_carterae.AAC.1
MIHATSMHIQALSAFKNGFMIARMLLYFAQSDKCGDDSLYLPAGGLAYFWEDVEAILDSATAEDWRKLRRDYFPHKFSEAHPQRPASFRKTPARACFRCALAETVAFHYYNPCDSLAFWRVRERCIRHARSSRNPHSSRLDDIVWARPPPDYFHDAIGRFFS